jgi:transcriptional regulator with XRE-family HTH domain
VHPGEIIRNKREELRLTQEEFGKKIGEKREKIFDIENDRRKLTPDIALKIEKIYGIPFKYQFTGEIQPGQLVDELPPGMGIARNFIFDGEKLTVVWSEAMDAAIKIQSMAKLAPQSGLDSQLFSASWIYYIKLFELEREKVA